MLNDKEYVIKAFKENFSEYKDKKIVIYGLGPNTKVLIEEFTDYSIIGLMDKVCTGDIVWGKKVISMEEAIEMKTDAIIILARFSNIPIIYNRIADKCKENAIPVFDINGELVSKKSREYALSPEYFEVTKRNLMGLIDEYDVISFDIFDTLLMRNVLFPTDIFELVAEKETASIPNGFDFVKQRIICERKLYSHTNPTIDEIYNVILEQNALTKELTEKLKQTELELEKEYIVPRRQMIEIVEYALKKGKKVCCTSDMYLNADFLKRLLNINGYKNITDVYVSCEYKTSKCQSLFEELKKQYVTKRILHIGDNKDADIASAKKSGISAFWIPSAYDMLENSVLRDIGNNYDKIEDRLYIADFITHFFNSPFSFAETHGKFELKSVYEIGYYFVEPLLSTFINWVINKMSEHKLDLLLLGSRDGWIVKKLLDIVNKYNALPFKYDYFYTSRAVSAISGIENDDDIAYVALMPFSGKTEELLKKRFLLEDADILFRKPEEKNIDYIFRHKEAILKKAEQCKNNYYKYYEKKNYSFDGTKVGYIDFVSSGSCQFWLQKIFNCEFIGLYFMRIFDEVKKDLKIDNMFEYANIYQKNHSKLFDNFIMLEYVLTSPEATVSSFDETGKCIFIDENRTSKQITDLLEIHDGIENAFMDRKHYKCENVVSTTLVDAVLDLLKSRYAIFKTDYFDNSVLNDEFCNRQFKMKSMVSIET